MYLEVIELSVYIDISGKEYDKDIQMGCICLRFKPIICILNKKSSIKSILTKVWTHL